MHSLDRPGSRKRTIRPRSGAWLVLLCVIASSIPLYGSAGPVSSDTVYCPLQKAWVDRRGEVEQTKPVQGLDEICSPVKQKRSFLFKLASNVLARGAAASSPNNTEKLYFNYLKHGRYALSEVNPFNDGPSHRFERTSGRRHGAGTSFTTDLSHEFAEVFVLEVLARPPTVNPSAQYNSRLSADLDAISRNLIPRAPPLSI